MCTLVAAVGQFAPWPLVIAANRDERLDRASSPPQLWEGEVPFVAPKDDVAGGSWLGINARGVFVGVTNRFGVPRDEKRASRGLLVTEALRQPSAAALHQSLSTLSAGRFNAFHLFYADLQGAYVTWSNGERVTQEKLGPGVHVITERSLGGDDRSRTELVKSGWSAVSRMVAPKVDAVAAVMRQHHPEDPLGSVCVHAPELNYGTRSSTLLFLAPSWSATRLLWSDGPPCRNDYDEQNHLTSLLASDAL